MNARERALRASRCDVRRRFLFVSRRCIRSRGASQLTRVRAQVLATARDESTGFAANRSTQRAFAREFRRASARVHCVRATARPERDETEMLDLVGRIGSHMTCTCTAEHCTRTEVDDSERSSRLRSRTTSEVAGSRKIAVVRSDEVRNGHREHERVEHILGFGRSSFPVDNRK